MPTCSCRCLPCPVPRGAKPSGSCAGNNSDCSQAAVNVGALDLLGRGGIFGVLQELAEAL